MSQELVKLTEYVYESNNSGGYWWLSDEEWGQLEQHGWTVEWFKDSTFFSDRMDDQDRWLGALAKQASKKFTSMDEAKTEFAWATGQNPSDQGCWCCGRPHRFEEAYDWGEVNE